MHLENIEKVFAKKYYPKLTSESEYRQHLKRLKMEFNQKYENNHILPKLNVQNEFDTIVTIGIGAFGTVKLYKHKKTNKFVAIKIIPKAHIVKYHQIDHILNEKKILQSIEFPFVVHMLFSYKDNNAIYFGVPFLHGGELFTLLRKHRRFDEKQAKFYAAQIFLAFEYLHYLDLIYRDLKPENIMLNRQGYLQLVDFGFCKRLNGRTATLCGTPEYLAPEIIQTKPYGKYVDWWSFGVFIYELVAGRTPFYAHRKQNHDHIVIYARIVDGKYDVPGKFSSHLKDLIKNLLQIDVTKRYGNLKNGTNDIKLHKWFTDINWIGLYNHDIEPPFIPAIKNDGDHSCFDNYPSTDHENVDYMKELNQQMLTTTNAYEKEFEDF